MLAQVPLGLAGPSAALEAALVCGAHCGAAAGVQELKARWQGKVMLELAGWLAGWVQW